MADRWPVPGRGFLALPVFLVLALLLPLSASDWPMYMADASRSGTSSEHLALPLQLQWAHRPVRPPCPAWPGPAPQDLFHHGKARLDDVLAFDQAFDVVVSGGNVLFGSSSEDMVCCLDRQTGRVNWTATTEGPVRFSPIAVGESVYFGSDDGCIYCVSSGSGKLAWKYRPGPEDVRLPGNGRVISLWPIRTGLIARKGTIYGAAGLFPDRGVYVVAVDAADGRPLWREASSLPVQGYLMMSEQRLFAPTGRMAPLAFDPATGKQIDRFDAGKEKGGSSYALMADQQLVYNNETGTLMIRDGTHSARLPLGLKARRMVLTGDLACFLSSDDMFALAWRTVMAATAAATAASPLDAAAIRKKSEVWTRHDTYTGGLIAVSDLLITGRPGQVVAIGAKDGQTKWTAAVDGLPCSLSAAYGSLFVSTDAGVIYCFSPTGAAVRPDAMPPATAAKERGGMVDRELDTSVAAVPETSPWPTDAATVAYAQLVAAHLDPPAPSKGYGLILGDDGRLAYELAARTALNLLILEEDTARAAETRDRLGRAGLLGARIGVIHGTLDTVRFPKYVANVIVSGSVLRGGALPAPSAVARLLRPEGGLAMIGRPAGALGGMDVSTLQSWLESTGLDGARMSADGGLWGVIRRGALAGAGEWTHFFGDAGNTACSGDQLAHGPMDVLWFGRPGPRYMIDRHHRNVPPLAKHGRLFIPGDDILFAVDAYNGTMLWHAAIPQSRRLGVFLDCGSMVVGERLLYVAQGDHCLGIDVATGAVSTRFQMPLAASAGRHDWGYLALEGDILLGSGRRGDAAYTEVSRAADDLLWDDAMSLVTSDDLFGMDSGNGRELWRYQRGRIVNTTLAANGGRVFFVETEAAKGKAGRLPLSELFADGRQYLVALDTHTGKELYRRSLDTSHFGMLIYLNCTANLVLVSGSKNVEKRVWYSFQAFDAASGTPVWEKRHATEFTPGGAHGEQNRHPTIVGDVVYAWPFAYRLATGDPIPGWRFERHGHGCGDISASSGALFWRGGNPWMRDLAPGSQATRLDDVVRPGCFINIIPAGGVVLMPEASSGCTCPFPLQMSIAHIPSERP